MLSNASYLTTTIHCNEQQALHEDNTRFVLPSHKVYELYEFYSHNFQDKIPEFSLVMYKLHLSTF
jgi:hypothetical protein